MLADRLVLSTGQLTERVEAVLAGAALEGSAVEAIDLADAVETYRAAGRAALQHRHDRTWFQARLAWPDWANAEPAFAAHVAPHLDQLNDGKAAWWFLRKYPDWRLRVRTPDHQAVERLLDDLVAAGTISGWRPSIYEPETAAFGGSLAMDIVHDLFCADSRGAVTYIRQQAPGLGRRELSFLLLHAMLEHAGLDWFEIGDVFDRVSQMRPTPIDGDDRRVETLAATMRRLWALAGIADTPMFAPEGPVGYAAPWLAAFIQAGRSLGAASTANRLDRGLRATIAQVVIFHWNRIGLSARTQGVLAHAAIAATLPRS